jgi:hypothetical protein
MKGHRAVEEQGGDVAVATHEPQPQEQSSNAAQAEGLGLGGGAPPTVPSGPVDLDRMLVADRFYSEALPFMEDLATSGGGPVEESPSYAAVVELWDTALQQLDDPVFELLEESLWAAADAAGGDAEVVGETVERARTEALQSATCDPDLQRVVDEAGPLPVDPARFGECIEAEPLPPATSPVPLTRDPLPDLGTCEPPTVDGTVDEAVPSLAGSEHVLELSADELSGLEAAVSLCDALHAEGPPSGLSDRFVDIGLTIGESALGPFLGAFTENLTDALVFDTLGHLGDDALAAALLRRGSTGAAKVPVIGPVISIALAGVDMAESGGPSAWATKQLEEFGKGVTDLGDMLVEIGAAWEAAWEGEGWEALTHSLNANAESASGLGHLCTGLASVSGLLSAVLYVIAFGATLTGVGVAIAAPALALAQALAQAASVLGVVALGLYAQATLFRSLASAVAPVEMYDEQTALLEDSSEALGKSSGGIAGSQLGTAVTKQVADTRDARKREAEVGEGEGPDGVPKGRADADAEIDRAREQVDQHGEALDEHRVRADQHEAEEGRSTGFDVASFLKGVAGHLADGGRDLVDLPSKMRQSADHAKDALDLTRGLKDAPEDEASLGQLVASLRLLGDRTEVHHDDIVAAKDRLAEGEASLAAYLARDVRNDPPGSDHVDTLTRIHAELADRRSDIAEAERQLKTTHDRITEVHEAMKAYEERLQIDLDRSLRGDGSGGLKDLAKKAVELASDALGLTDRVKAEAAEVNDRLWRFAGCTDTTLAIARDTDAGDAGLYVAEHGDEVAAEAEALEEAHDRLERLLAPPPVSLLDPLEQSDTMVEQRDGFLVDQAAAYALGMLEGTAHAGESLLVPEEVITDLTDRADTLDTQVSDSLAANAQARGELSSAEQVEVPDGLMDDLAEANDLAGDHGDLSTQGSVEVPEGDAATDVAAMQQTLGGESDRLDAEQERLAETRKQLTSVREGLNEPLRNVSTDRDALRAAGDEAASEKTAALGDAEAHRGQAEDAADQIASDVGSLGAWAERQQESRR